MSKTRAINEEGNFRGIVLMAEDKQQRDFLNHLQYVDLESVLRFIAFGWNDPSFIDDVKEVQKN